MRSLFVSLALILLVPLARAQAIAPDKDIQGGDAAKIAALVEAKIVPHFDFGRTTRIAMGPAWRAASPEQQARLTSEFTQLLLRTYSGALASYRNQIEDRIRLEGVRCHDRRRQPGGHWRRSAPRSDIAQVWQITSPRACLSFSFSRGSIGQSMSEGASLSRQDLSVGRSSSARSMRWARMPKLRA